MKLNVPRIAQLANLPITPQEEKKLEKQLLETLSYIDQLSEVDTKNVEPTSHVTGLKNVTRDDSPKPSLSQKDALSNSDKTYDGYFIVDAILDNG